MGRRSFLLIHHLLFLAFTHLIIFSTAITSSRMGRVTEGVREIYLHNQAFQVRNELEQPKLEGNSKDRYLDLEDYPGSGANGRHSPP